MLRQLEVLDRAGADEQSKKVRIYHFFGVDHTVTTQWVTSQ